MKCSEVANAALTFSPDFAMAPVAVSTHGRTHGRTDGRTLSQNTSIDLSTPSTDPIENFSSTTPHN